MPYASREEMTPSLRGIDPPITLTQGSMIARWADRMTGRIDSPWAVAIAQFKRLYQVNPSGRGWSRKVAGDPNRIPGSQGIGEAATVKSRVRGLLRDVQAILKLRAVPQRLRSELEDVAREITKTWADLRIEADWEMEEPE